MYVITMVTVAVGSVSRVQLSSPTGCLEVSYLGAHVMGYPGSPLLVLPLTKLMGIYPFL